MSEDEKANDTNEFDRLAGERRQSLPVEFWYFLKHNKKWWLLPIIIVIVLLGPLVFWAATGCRRLSTRCFRSRRDYLFFLKATSRAFLSLGESGSIFSAARYCSIASSILPDFAKISPRL